MKTRKPTRKQPRSKTPPLLLLSDGADGVQDRIIADVDSVTWNDTHPIHSRRFTGFLEVEPGIRITILSRTVCKRRFPVVHVSLVSKAAPAKCFEHAIPAGVEELGGS